MVSSVAGNGSQRHTDVPSGGQEGTPYLRGAQDVRDAAWRIGRAYPGGIPCLAQRLEVNAETLKKKLNPNCETHRLSVDEAVDVQLHAQRFDVLHAMAWSLDHVAIHVPDAPAEQVAARLAVVGAEVGDVFRLAQQVLADGQVTPNERRELATQITEAISALSAVLKGL